MNVRQPAPVAVLAAITIATRGTSLAVIVPVIAGVGLFSVGLALCEYGGYRLEHNERDLFGRVFQGGGARMMCL